MKVGDLVRFNRKFVSGHVQNTAMIIGFGVAPNGAAVASILMDTGKIIEAVYVASLEKLKT